MEHSIQNETAIPAGNNDGWQPRPELLTAMKNIATIAQGDDTAVISDRQISFNNGAQRTTITAFEVDLVTVDGLQISERIDIRTQLPEVFAETAAEQLALANTMATTGAIIIDPDKGAEMVSSLPVFEIDTVALEDLYTLMVANGAKVHLYGPLAAAQYYMGASPTEPSQVAAPGRDEPSYWDEGEFTQAAGVIRGAGFYCNAGESTLTAEFPWDEGATSAVVGDCTSLMRF